MQKFKDYLDHRLSNQQFHLDYHQNCAICAVTIKILQEIAASPYTPNEIAEQLQIPVQVIRNLEIADDCCVEAVVKLAAFFNIPRSGNCLKENINH